MAKVCVKCGKVMPDGHPAYEIRIQVAADFDGVLAEGGSPAEVESKLQALVNAMELADPRNLPGTCSTRSATSSAASAGIGFSPTP